jgi:hypothetical protein
MKNRKYKLEIALTISLSVFICVLFSCSGNKFKSRYSGEVSDKKGIPLKGVAIYAISNGKADSNLVHALSPEEITLFKGEKDINSSFGGNTDTSGRFTVVVELENLSAVPSMHLLFRKSGYKSVLIDMVQGIHDNMGVKLDSIEGN